LDVGRCAFDGLSLNAPLLQSIRRTIREQGPQSFAWFMHQALYDPDYGYYSSDRCRIGREGDYYTNVSVGPLYGRLLACQFFEIWERLGRARDFLIVEQGAYDGVFARDVLLSLRTGLPEFFKALRYRILEPFPALEERQRQTLRGFEGKVEWRRLAEPFAGIHFSNELFDSMPVRLISDGVEKLVGLKGDDFVFVESPIAEPIFNQAALEAIDEIAGNLERGCVIAVDYGSMAGQFKGSIQVRAAHRNLDSPFRQIGTADITMPVDWKSIIDRARANGLRVVGFTDQHHFLTGIVSQAGTADRRQSFIADSRKAKRQLQTLLHPEMLGRAFQVLALAKNASLEPNHLAGFKFADRLRSAVKLTDSVQ
jgi:SAM-dependent MidA family methyltransferase